jgi:putative transposase
MSSPRRPVRHAARRGCASREQAQIIEVLPLLYLHGLSSKDFTPAPKGFLGTDAGLSAAMITRLTTQWQDDAHRFADRDLSSVDYIYPWADGVQLRPYDGWPALPGPT